MRSISALPFPPLPAAPPSERLKKRMSPSPILIASAPSGGVGKLPPLAFTRLSSGKQTVTRSLPPILATLFLRSLRSPANLGVGGSFSMRPRATPFQSRPTASIALVSRLSSLSRTRPFPPFRISASVPIPSISGAKTLLRSQSRSPCKRPQALMKSI